MAIASFTIPTTKLRSAIARMVDTCPNKSRKPILSNIWLSVNGTVSLAGTDLERNHCENLTSVCEHEGKADVLINARNFRSLLTGVKDKRVTVTIDKTDKMHVVSIGNRRQGCFYDATHEDLPYKIAVASPECSVSVSGDDLARLIERTAFACDTESSRYAIGALLVEMDDSGYLRLVGTDGRRLATDYIGAPAGKQIEALWAVTFAKKALKAIRKADNCRLSIAGNVIQLTCYQADGQISHWDFRQIEGRFPKWRDVFPNDHAPVCVVDANQLNSACEDVIQSTKHLDESGQIRESASFCSADNVLTVSASHAECFAALDCSSELNKLDDVLLNASFVRDFAKACKDAVLTINARQLSLDDKHTKQRDCPIRIECGSADYIVMPLAK